MVLLVIAGDRKTKKIEDCKTRLFYLNKNSVYRQREIRFNELEVRKEREKQEEHKNNIRPWKRLFQWLLCLCWVGASGSVLLKCWTLNIRL